MAEGQGGETNMWEQKCLSLLVASRSSQCEHRPPLEEDCVINLASESHFHFSEVLEISEEKEKRRKVVPNQKLQSPVSIVTTSRLASHTAVCWLLLLCLACPLAYATRAGREGTQT